MTSIIDFDGPWHTEISGDEDCSEVYVCHAKTECDESIVATVGDINLTHQENMERAKLISAAPELLEACEMALEVFSEIGDCDGQCAVLSNAISKAYGDKK